MSKLRSVDTRISLFPFLSILTCTIGVLILIITLLAVSHVHAGPLVLATRQQKVLQETYVRLIDDVSQTQAEIDRHNSMIAQAKLLTEQLRQLQRELQHVQDRRAERALTAEELERVNQEINRRKLDVSDLEGKLRAAQASRDALQKKVDELPAPGTIRVVASRRYAAGGLDHVSSTKPIFLECRENEIISHPTKRVIPESQIESGSTLGDIINNAAQRGNEGTILVFLIRPNGVKVYDKAAGRVRRNEDVRWGILPLPGVGDIDLSVFFPDK